MKIKVMLGFCLFILLTGCNQSSTEKLVLACQKPREYKDYSSTSVVGLYGINLRKINKLEIAEEYVPKEKSSQMEILKKQMEIHKKEINKQYENVKYTIDDVEGTVTSDMTIPLSTSNLETMKLDENYQKMVEKGIFDGSIYKEILIQSGYICN